MLLGMFGLLERCVRSYTCVCIPPYQCFGISMSFEPCRSRSGLLPFGDFRFALDVVSTICNNSTLVFELVRHGLGERGLFAFGDEMCHPPHLLDWRLTSVNFSISEGVFLTYPPTMLSQPNKIGTTRLRPDSAGMVVMRWLVWSSRFSQWHFILFGSNMIQCGCQHLG